MKRCPDREKDKPTAALGRNRARPDGLSFYCLAGNRRSANEACWRRRYGLTRADVADLRVEQGNSCAICGAPEPEHLDHDHLTGRIRALLCQRCNQGLGLLRDDPTVLRAAADYVEEHREHPAHAASAARFDARLADASSSSPGMRRWRAMYPDWPG